MNTLVLHDEIALLGLEPRLRRRYRTMVDQHSAPTTPIAAGLRAIPGGTSAFAATQAAWRFLKNPRVTLPVLMAPVIAHVRQQVQALPPQSYLLVAHDWSWLNFTRHRTKPDRITPSHPKAPGYTLFSGLAISPQNGAPLGMLSAELTCSLGVHTTHREGPQPELDQQSQLQSQVEHLEKEAMGRPLVHIVDRGGDAVANYRFFQEAKRWCLIRADGNQRVMHQGTSCLLSEIPQHLLFISCGSVLYKGKPARQSIAETEVVLTRPASNGSHHTPGARPVPGPPVPLRLLVSDIRDEEGVLLARWFLYTNLPQTEAGGVEGIMIARWYYWRWRIESFHKLLKSAGWNLEDWQQESGLAILKRLLVVAMAASLVWAVQYTEVPEVQELQKELVRLSGRQMHWGRPITGPALLAGLWTLLGTLELLERYDPEQIRLLGQKWRALTTVLGP